MKTVIRTDKAPAALGPYSVGIVANGFVFCSGQLGIDPGTGDFVSGGVSAQAEQAMKNLNSVLAASGCGFKDIVKTTIFLADMADFAEVNKIYGSYFESDFPARSTIAVKTLPKSGLVEIEAIAVLP
ncbi:MAG TPA: RidA family protein [Anaerolineales bacterium]|nr:RidA family protein [Anaerolineales bacterium]